MGEQLTQVAMRPEQIFHFSNQPIDFAVHIKKHNMNSQLHINRVWQAEQVIMFIITVKYHC